MVGGKTVRACDSCLNKRASFYCKADDAFLCQTCDVSVHSANQVARRHERIRLNKSAASSKKSSNNLLGSAELDSMGSAPAWHRGFTRKARSTRKAAARTRIDDNKSALPIVPEISNEEDLDVDVDDNDDDDDDDERLLYQVPVFDPFGVDNDFDIELNSMLMGRDGNEKLDIDEEENRDDEDLKNLDRLLETDMDLAEFAADVESLLGKGMDEDDGSGWIKGLGLFEQCKKEPDSLMIEDDIDQSQLDVLGSDLIDQSQLKINVPKLECHNKDCNSNSPIYGTKNKLLRLNHEAVIAAWSPETSPWADGSRPVYNREDLVNSIFDGSSSLNQTYGGIHMGNVRIDNEEREARVSRYREKRRTRLFSKKIRYEVRKINAEKRPRMKGRFVKRIPSFAGSAPYNTYLVLNNSKSP